ncbi:MBL fold metallo-hydrolase, partial [Paenibacillus glucanolyticus]
DQVRAAVQALRKQDLVRFGTGIHRFDGFSVQF